MAKKTNSSTKVKNILFLSQHLSLGGLERVIVQTASHLSPSYKPFIFIYDHHDSSSSLIPSLVEMGIPFQATQKKAGFSLNIVFKIILTCFREKITVIHSHDLGALIYGSFVKIGALFFLKRLKLVHTQHSFVHFEKNLTRYKFYERFFTRFTNHITVVHQNIEKEYIQLGIPNQKISIIENGAEFTPSPPINNSEKIKDLRINLLEGILKNKLLPNQKSLENLSSLIQKHWVLSLGRLSDKKGIRDLIEIFNILRDEKIVLFIVGPEQEPGYIQQLNKLNQNKNVVFAGPSFHPLLWLESCESVISASHYEGHPLTILEALGSGLELYLSDIKGHQFFEQFKNLPIHFFSSKNPVRAASEIQFNVKPEKINNFENAAFIREKFGLQKMTLQFEKLYNE